METGIITKEYIYNKNGKNVIVRRKYTVKGDRKTKHTELDDYFKYNIDELKSKKKLKDIVEDYNNKGN